MYEMLQRDCQTVFVMYANIQQMAVCPFLTFVYKTTRTARNGASSVCLTKGRAHGCICPNGALFHTGHPAFKLEKAETEKKRN